MKNINNEMDWNVFVVFSLFIVTYFGNLKLFQAFVRSKFQYSHFVWHFTSNANTLKIEKLQQRAIRIVFND